MGALECAGCAMLAFAPPFALFIFTIVCDPLRVILFVAGAFFWLLALLCSSIWWYAVVPLRNDIWFGLLFSVVFQEVFRFVYFILLKKAENGLQKVSDTGMHIEGVHSLANAKHTISYVCGVGFGTMSGAFSLINVLADGKGPGTPGLVSSSGYDRIIQSSLDHHGNYLFFLTSSFIAAAIILLHISWNVIFWHSCYTRRPLSIVAVITTHFFVSLLTLVNEHSFYYVSIPLIYAVTILMGLWATKTAGISANNFSNLLINLRQRIRLESSGSAANQSDGINGQVAATA